MDDLSTACCTEIHRLCVFRGWQTCPEESCFSLTAAQQSRDHDSTGVGPSFKLSSRICEIVGIQVSQQSRRCEIVHASVKDKIDQSIELVLSQRNCDQSVHRGGGTGNISHKQVVGLVLRDSQSNMDIGTGVPVTDRPHANLILVRG